jgi:hypothetical protein
MSEVLSTIQKALLANDTGPLWEFLNAGGQVDDLGEHYCPLYYYPNTCSDLALVKLLFERGMKLEEDFCFFTGQNDMSDDVFDWALENDLDKAKTSSPVLFFLVSNFARFKRVFERGADIHLVFSVYLPRPLIMHAVGTNNKDVVAFLVEKGADINARLQDGWTSLMEAGFNSRCDEDMIELLVKLGADYHARYKGETVIMIVAAAIYKGGTNNYNKLKYLLTLYQGWADEVDEEGNTALHLAALRDNGAQNVDLLLKNGFDPMRANKKGITPIEICIREDCTEKFKPFWEMIQNDPVRFAGLDILALCEKHSAIKMRAMITFKSY